MAETSSSKAYLDQLESRVENAPGCKELAEAAREAMESLIQAQSEAQEAATRLLALITIPTDLPGVIKWIEAQASQYITPYETYMKQIAVYAEKLARIEAALAKKASELTCQGLVESMPKPPNAPGL